jgi:uncharacterized protein
VKLPVEVVLAGVDRLHRVQLELPAGSCVDDAIRESGLSPLLPSDAAFGVFGSLRSGRDALAAGDRVEIYRPLLADPKQSRRRRAARRKVP